jgi:hypothetical protein
MINLPVLISWSPEDEQEPQNDQDHRPEAAHVELQELVGQKPDAQQDQDDGHDLTAA